MRKGLNEYIESLTLIGLTLYMVSCTPWKCVSLMVNSVWMYLSIKDWVSHQQNFVAFSAQSRHSALGELGSSVERQAGLLPQELPQVSKLDFTQNFSLYVPMKQRGGGLLDGDIMRSLAMCGHSIPLWGIKMQ